MMSIWKKICRLSLNLNRPQKRIKKPLDMQFDSWKESILSGEALAGEATTGTFGEINSSALEQANVNLTTELIDLIIAQRNFQANSRSLEVNNQLNQTILNIR